MTGSQAAPLARASGEAAAVRRAIGVPVVVGFGIDSAEKARAAAAHADGVVVGTALVLAIEAGATREGRSADTTRLVRSLRQALDIP